ncbi:MAG: GNAT family N-acetyltransferase [Bacteroidia bacterium]
MAPTDINIQPAVLSDINRLKEISEKTFYETFAAQNTKENMEKYISATFNLNQVSAELNDSQNKFFLALLNNQLAGYVKLHTGQPPEHLKNKKTIEIERIYVSKKYHNMKVGASLMSHSIQYAAANKFDIIWLGVWEYNPRAIKFYERWDFEKFGTHIFILGDDPQTDVLMLKELNP